MREMSKPIARSGVVSAPRILVVEDEIDVALLISYNLEAEGYVVESVARGDEAELRLAESAPDLLILDWMLPGVSGIELCRRLRADGMTRKIPLIALSANAMPDDISRARAAGFDVYLTKPIDVIRMLAEIERLLPT